MAKSNIKYNTDFVIPNKSDEMTSEDFINSTYNANKKQIDEALGDYAGNPKDTFKLLYDQQEAAHPRMSKRRLMESVADLSPFLSQEQKNIQSTVSALKDWTLHEDTGKDTSLYNKVRQLLRDKGRYEKITSVKKIPDFKGKSEIYVINKYLTVTIRYSLTEEEINAGISAITIYNSKTGVTYHYDDIDSAI